VINTKFPKKKMVESRGIVDSINRVMDGIGYESENGELSGVRREMGCRRE
jgi:hypothetical protein